MSNSHVIDATLKLVDNFTPILRTVNKACETTKTAMKSMGDSIKKVGSDADKHKTKLAEMSKAYTRMAKDIKKSGQSIQEFCEKASLITVPLTAAAVAGIKLHADFEDGVAKISTLVDTDVISMQQLSNGIREVSDKTGASVAELSEAEYQAISAGVDATKVTQFLEVATKSSIAGFTDSATAINGLSTVLNAYGLQAEDAAKISDQMLVTQNLGKTTFGEMAQSMGNVIPIAAQLGVTTDELFGSIAALTKNGIQTSESITGLKAAYSNIIKPSSEAAKMAQSMGLEFNAAHLKSVGWVQFLNEVQVATGGDTAKMGQLFGSVEALNSVLVLTGKGNKDFVDSVKAMGDSNGITEQSFYKLLTPAKQNQIALNQLKNAAMDMASGLTPLLRATTVLMKNAADTLKSLTPEQKEMLENFLKTVIVLSLVGVGVGKVVSVFGGMLGTLVQFGTAIETAGGFIPLLVGKIKSIATVFTLVFNVIKAGMSVMMMNPWILAITVIIGLAVLLYQNWDTVKAFFINLWDSVTQAFNSFIAFLGSCWDGTKAYFINTWESIKQSVWQALVNLIGQDKINAIVAKVTNLINLIKQTFASRVNTIASVFNSIRTKIASVFNSIKTVIVSIINSIVNVIKPPVMRIVTAVVSAFNNIKSKVMSIVMAIRNTITSYFGAIFTAIRNIINIYINSIYNTVSIIVNGIVDIFGGFIDFVMGVFSGDMDGALNGLSEMFQGWESIVTGVFENIKSTCLSVVNTIIDSINSISFTVPDWVPDIGGQTFQPSLPHFAGGTDDFVGGNAVINEKGGEIVNLPNHTQVIPHDKSLQQEYARGKADGQGKGNGINITIQSMTVRQDSDIDRIANLLAEKINLTAQNLA
jgi:TP901 family phage tail tape measure protein